MTVRRAGALSAVTGIILLGTTGIAHAQTSRDQAGDIVTDRYGGQVISVESDSENGEATWEVEVRNSNRGRIEVDVSKSSGDIVAIEAEDDDDSEDHSDGADVQDNSDPGDDGNGDSDGGDDSDDQVSPRPDGGVDAGNGSTSGVEEPWVLAAGASLLALGGAGLVLRRRTRLQ